MRKYDKKAKFQTQNDAFMFLILIKRLFYAFFTQHCAS